MSVETLSDSQLAELRASYRQAMDAGSESCPEDENLAALATGELGGESPGLADHVVSCRRCAERYRTLRELHLAAEGRTGGRVTRWRRPLRATFAVAAMLVVALGLYHFLAPPTPDSSRSGAGDQLRTTVSELEVTPADGAVLGAPPRSLAWPAQTGAGTYRVHLFDAGAEPLWESGPLSEPGVDLPEPQVAELRSGGSFFWVVRMSGFSQRRELGPFWFEVGG
ncbi:MAG: hypothetical protein GY719_02770 [bacterium]|nr:hypothetical protein [bacterium]